MAPADHSMSRRKFLGVAGAAALTPALAKGAGLRGFRPDASGGRLSLWNGSWPVPQTNTLSSQLISKFKYRNYTANYDVLTGNIYEVVEAALAAKKGPAVAGGYAYMAFQYANQGQVLPADSVVAALKASGDMADYVSASEFSNLKVPGFGYVAVPWGVDTRVLWYNETLLQKAGASVPTDWPSYLAACKALKKIGVYGYVTAAATSNAAYGTHTLAYWMLNNGGGMFDEHGNVDCLYSRNVEAVEFLLELVQGGYVDPGSIGYTDTDVYTELKSGRVGMTLANPTIPEETGTDPSTGPFKVMSPIAGPHGDKATLQYLKNFMMFKNTPSAAASEALLLYWTKLFGGKNSLFVRGNTGAVPIRKSVVNSPAVQSNPQLVKIINEWVPIAKEESARCPYLFAGLATVDNGTSMLNCIQTILEGSTTATAALSALQKGIAGYGASYKGV
jgi:multiple sugar transport system substrate-binding protein